MRDMTWKWWLVALMVGVCGDVMLDIASTRPFAPVVFLYLGGAIARKVDACN